MGYVWDVQDLSLSEKLILLAYADHARHDGTHIWPSRGTVARMSGCSPRTVQRVTQSLQERGMLLLEGKHSSGTLSSAVPAVLAPRTFCRGGRDFRRRGWYSL